MIKCSLCGINKDEKYFADQHARCGECEYHTQLFFTKQQWKEEIENEKQNQQRPLQLAL